MTARINLSATRPLILTGAPFTSVANVGGAKDSENVLTAQFSSSAATLWDRLVGFRFAGLGDSVVG